MRRLLPIILLLFAGQAAAQSITPPGTIPPKPPAPESSPVYTGSVVKADAVAGGLLLGGTVLFLVCDANSAGFEYDHATCPFAIGAYVGAVSVYALGPMAVHLGHGNRARAVGSLALRVGLPAAGIALSGGDDGAAALGLGGAGVAILIDWLILSRPGGGERPPPARWQPALAPTRGGAAVGIGGVF